MIGQTVSHYLVDVYDLLHHEGSDVIVMELVTGQTLDRAVVAKPLRGVLGYARQPADALAKAHGAGIVHRDLKPSNVMVDEIAAGLDSAREVRLQGLSRLRKRRWLPHRELPLTRRSADAIAGRRATSKR